VIKSVKLNNFLSFGSNSQEIELHPLNIVIGTNGSGKSNFLEAFDLLRNVPRDIRKPIREGGGVLDWLYYGSSNLGLPASLVFMVSTEHLPQKAKNHDTLRYELAFSSYGSRFELVKEKLTNSASDQGLENLQHYFDYHEGTLVVDSVPHGPIIHEFEIYDDDNRNQSVFCQVLDVNLRPEVTCLAKEFDKIRLYRDWTFGRHASYRQPQKLDEPNQYLESDCSNLGLILNKIQHHLPSKKRLLEELQNFYGDVEDYVINLEGSYAQIYFHERGLSKPVSATRLSDGTLRYLSLLAILCNPNPPPLICIEEPELGLHPDVIPELAKLMIEASERCQLIVTTHSDILVDSFHYNPEVILVAEKTGGETHLTRLQNGQLAPWLEKYRLGALWTRGDLGGVRW